MNEEAQANYERLKKQQKMIEEALGKTPNLLDPPSPLTWECFETWEYSEFFDPPLWDFFENLGIIRFSSTPPIQNLLHLDSL